MKRQVDAAAGKGRRRVRPLLLLLLWIWAVSVFLTLDLFLNVRGLDAIRPRSDLYRSLRYTGHELVGEPYLEDDAFGSLEDGPPSPAPGGAWIEGVVYGPDRRPVPGAHLAARDLSTSEWVSASARGDGTFRLAAARGRAYDLAAAGAGHTGGVRLHITAPAEVSLLLEPGGRIAGRVADPAGSGVAGVVLRLEAGRAPDPAQDYLVGPEFRDLERERALERVASYEAVSGPDGAFAFESVDPGYHDVIVAGGPVRIGESTSVYVPGPAEVPCAVLVERSEPIVVRGFVRDEATARPLAGAEVEFRPGGVALTDGDGAFEKRGVVPGLLGIEVRVDGRPRLSVTRVVDGAELDFRVPEGRVVTGQVLDPDARPVPGARVRWTGVEEEHRQAHAGADGRFRLAGIAADHPGLLRAEARGFAAAEAPAVPGAGEIVIRLEEGARLEGRVGGPDGAPAAEILVLLFPGGLPGAGDDEGRPRTTRTDAQGRYVFEDLPRGPVAIAAVTEGNALAPAIIDAEAPGQAPDMRLRPARAVEGDVIDVQGAPVSGALVRVASRIRRATTLTDERGRFVLTGRPEIDEPIVVTRPGYVAAKAMLRPERSSPLRIRLAPVAPR